MVKVLKNLRLYGERLTDITVGDGRIISVSPTELDGEDFGGACIFPGLIDIHSHGCMGYDTMDGAEAICEIAKYQRAHGVTTYYPTTMTQDFFVIESVINTPLSLEDAPHVYGFHMEGPYIAKKYKGAQNEKFVISPSTESYGRLKNVALVTVAPEVDGALDFISECDAVVCLGHTAATFDEADRGFKAGAKCITHTFNAMPPFHHRDTSVIGAGIENDAYAQLICDGVHVSRPAVLILYRTFGKDRVILISDSMRATGLDDGEYELGGQMMTVKGGEARTPDGALAGSTTNLFDCVKKAIEFGIPVRDAFDMASKTPAALMGLNKGVLDVGYDADFIILDENLNLLKTLIL